MSMTEQPTEAPPAAKRKPAAKRRRRRAAPKAAAPAAAPKPVGIFAGMTVSKCPSACNEARCVISGVNVCAHPGMGGLQASVQTNEAMDRFKQSQRFLGEQKLDLTAK